MMKRFAVAMWALSWAGLACGAGGDEIAELNTFDNAAYEYWKAAALTQEVLTEIQFEAVLFAERELPNLPPKAFAYRPAAGRWLLNERLMLEALHKGAAQPHCMFIRVAEATAQDVLLYRAAVRGVMMRALASAKAHEFVGNTRATGSIYADLLRMLRHQDEGGDWAAVDFTLSLLPMVLSDIEGFLSRAPPRDAVEMITRELDAAGDPRFPLPPMLDREGDAYSEWLTNNPVQVQAKIAGLYGTTILKPALTELMALEPDQDLARVRSWVDAYRGELDRLEAGLGLPYAEAIQVVREIDGTVAGAAGAEVSNPLLPLLMPPMAATYDRYVAAEAHLVLIEVLCYSAIYQDFVGAWPDTIEILAQFSGGQLPPDPYTGGHVRYDLKGKLPRVEVEAPRQVEEMGAITKISLRRRVEADEEAVASLVREMEREQRMEKSKANQEALDEPVKKTKTTRGQRLRGGR